LTTIVDACELVVALLNHARIVTARANPCDFSSGGVAAVNAGVLLSVKGKATSGLIVRLKSA
jgi:hypothetical protein